MINFELIYKLSDLQTDCLSNLEVGHIRAAKEKAAQEFAAYTDAIAAAIGTDDFEVTNIACVAKGVWHHVYTPTQGIPREVGRRKCIFCGNDDFEM